MINYVVYFTFLFLGFALAFRVLRTLEIEKYFKKGKIAEINVAYFIISLITGHLLGEFALRVITLFMEK
ncbi:predicted conserved hypothetical protein, integral membrane YwzB [Alteracholeplasma palmae J233]|uniref:DUF1146 domain-containing protein n=1 Tax=Alteracholeplasma palmae (strain ATCC 49389 / J233) TaxID=1318466 RepID=U4KLP4_ALTPJ|nr:DUF1146 family protein [Alteracholeplasma palmae]CCV64808.1 predicted conserved hypothetical protein, integral membrane YwzB [Alteracholeplasma palmae J233]